MHNFKCCFLMDKAKVTTQRARIKCPKSILTRFTSFEETIANDHSHAERFGKYNDLLKKPVLHLVVLLMEKASSEYEKNIWMLSCTRKALWYNGIAKEGEYEKENSHWRQLF